MNSTVNEMLEGIRARLAESAGVAFDDGDEYEIVLKTGRVGGTASIHKGKVWIRYVPSTENVSVDEFRDMIKIMHWTIKPAP